jgi:hypothetical protein
MIPLCRTLQCLFAAAVDADSPQVCSTRCAIDPLRGGTTLVNSRSAIPLFAHASIYRV